MPPGGGGGAPGGAPGGLPNLDDPLFKFAMQRRQGGGQMGGGQDEGQPQPGGQPGGYSGWTPPVPQDDVAGIGHRFGQQMNQGEPFHSGVDLQAVEGTPTISPVDGVVQRVEYNPQGLGITVVLQGKDGTTHKLGHLKETGAYAGLVVSQGQDLQSKVGSTGNTTGSHLHWAVKTPDGQPTDPTGSLGGMANMPPVPGTQMMGPPGGSAAPGGPGGRGSPGPAAANPGALAVPGQGAPPPQPQAQPPLGAPPPQMPPGAGADNPYESIKLPWDAYQQGQNSVKMPYDPQQDAPWITPGDMEGNRPQLDPDAVRRLQDSNEANPPPLPWVSPEGHTTQQGIATPYDTRLPYSGKPPPGGSGNWDVKRPTRNRGPKALEVINRKALGGVARDPGQEPDQQWWEELGKRSSPNSEEVDPDLIRGGGHTPAPDWHNILNVPNVSPRPRAGRRARPARRRRSPPRAMCPDPNSSCPTCCTWVWAPTTAVWVTPICPMSLTPTRSVRSAIRTRTRTTSTTGT
jgi:murein DD-endopeptidase MepM/ murein hydrolase activator NlpD